MVPLVEDDICSQVTNSGPSDDEDFYAEDMICAGGASGAEVCSVQFREHIINMSLHNLRTIGLIL